MTKPTYDILLDFDDVIYPFCDGLEKVLADEGIYGNITQWEVHKDYGMSVEEFWDLVYQPKHEETLYMQRIDLETLTAMRRLRYQGHRLHIVTSRIHPRAIRYCYEVLSRDAIRVDTVDFARDKAPFVQEYNAEFSIDDHVRHYENYNQWGHLNYLMDRPHNIGFQGTEDDPSVRRVQNLTEFANLIEVFQSHGVKVRGSNK